MTRLAVTALVATVAIATTAAASASGTTLDPLALEQAQRIRFDITARYVRPGGPQLRVTEASSTGVVESFVLLTASMDEVRVVPADSGIYYAICAVRAECPYPSAKHSRPAANFIPRRQALELALRTFLETSATLVAVSLPTRDFRLFIIEREELAREVDMAALARGLSGNPARAPATSLRRTVDDVTRPRIYVPLGLEPSPSGRDSFAAMPLWPTPLS